jgi:formyltetrahydrofolate hydrolase
MLQDHQYILTLSCRDAKGIVHAVSGLLYQAGCNIIDSQQFGDLEGPDATGFFFMRVHFEAPPHLSSIATLDTLFATAHYVTADLDEGPIIEQDVERVDHSLSAEDFTAVGRDIECVVLARAVRWHVQRRVLMNGHKTVVFR